MARGRKRSSSYLARLVWLLLLAALGWGGKSAWEQWRPPPRGETPAATTKVFQVLLRPSLVAGAMNDGDSFQMLHEGRTYHFRLYFVDCPEKTRQALYEERLAEQGGYFGGLDEAQTAALGQEAAAFTEQWLGSTPVTVYTRWQKVYGGTRHYAFVVFPDGEDLSAKLVRAGLARIHTTGTTLPDGRDARGYEAWLRQMEAEARAARRGGWR